MLKKFADTLRTPNLLSPYNSNNICFSVYAHFCLIKEKVAQFQFSKKEFKSYFEYFKSQVTWCMWQITWLKYFRWKNLINCKFCKR